MAKPSKILRELRLDKRLTQQQVAEKMKVSQSYYSAVERGQKPADFDTAFNVVNRMRTRTNRTAGGNEKTGRQKS